MVFVIHWHELAMDIQLFPKETQMYRTDFWTLWEKARVGCFKRTASKHVYYLGWNRSPAQVGCMRQALGPGALGRPRGSGWRGRWEGGSGWGTHVNPWLFHFNVWQNSLQIKKKRKKKKECLVKKKMFSDRKLEMALISVASGVFHCRLVSFLWAEFVLALWLKGFDSE